MKNPITGIPFGQERTVKDHLMRAEWEHDQASRLRVQKSPIGYTHIAQAHEDTARSYETRARELERGAARLTAPVTGGGGMTRPDLVNRARVVAAKMFKDRKSLTPTLIKKALTEAFGVIQRADPTTGTSHHPFAAYSHGIAALAAEGVDQAQRAWTPPKKKKRS